MVMEEDANRRKSYNGIRSGVGFKRRLPWFDVNLQRFLGGRI